MLNLKIHKPAFPGAWHSPAEEQRCSGNVFSTPVTETEPASGRSGPAPHRLRRVVVQIVLVKEPPCFNTAQRHGAARRVLFSVLDAFHHSLLDNLENNKQGVITGNPPRFQDWPADRKDPFTC